MKFDAYEFKARIVPAFFTIIIPIMVFNHFYVSEEFSKFISDVVLTKVVANLTIALICLYYLSQIGRFFAKNIFQRIYFQEELKMPTTSSLLFGDSTYSVEYKNKIREKVLTDFSIQLPTEADEVKDEFLACTRIVETMAHIRKKLQGNKFLTQHNVEYGAMRNTIGGAVLGTIFSLINIIFFSSYVDVPLAVNISYVTLCVYLLLIIFSKVIINAYGKSYAKILFREYMS